MRNERTNDKREAPRSIPIDWEALEDAFENNAPEVHSYLHLGSGEVLRIVDGVADPEMHARIVSEPDYLRVESVSSREQYRWMERFIQMVEDGALKGLLMRAIDGKGAFRRFKDVLMAHSAERERWFVFRSERLRVFMEAWLTAHALVAVERKVWPSDSEASPLPPEENAARRPRGAEATRRRIEEALEGLAPKDLDRVLVFVEFVRSRRGPGIPPGTKSGPADESEAEGSAAKEDVAVRPVEENKGSTVVH